jgi:hypothetical protein
MTRTALAFTDGISVFRSSQTPQEFDELVLQEIWSQEAYGVGLYSRELRPKNASRFGGDFAACSEDGDAGKRGVDEVCVSGHEGAMRSVDGKMRVDH